MPSASITGMVRVISARFLYLRVSEI